LERDDAGAGISDGVGIGTIGTTGTTG